MTRIKSEGANAIPGMVGPVVFVQSGNTPQGDSRENGWYKRIFL